MVLVLSRTQNSSRNTYVEPESWKQRFFGSRIRRNIFFPFKSWNMEKFTRKNDTDEKPVKFMRIRFCVSVTEQSHIHYICSKRYFVFLEFELCILFFFLFFCNLWLFQRLLRFHYVTFLPINILDSNISKLNEAHSFIPFTCIQYFSPEWMLW